MGPVAGLARDGRTSRSLPEHQRALLRTAQSTHGCHDGGAVGSEEQVGDRSEPGVAGREQVGHGIRGTGEQVAVEHRAVDVADEMGFEQQQQGLGVSERAAGHPTRLRFRPHRDDVHGQVT